MVEVLEAYPRLVDHRLELLVLDLQPKTQLHLLHLPLAAEERFLYRRRAEGQLEGPSSKLT